MNRVLAPLRDQVVPFVIHDREDEGRAHVHVRSDMVVHRGVVEWIDGKFSIRNWYFGGRL